MTISQNVRAIFYVYILFDENAVPRYVGKGKGNRWLAHDRAADPNNSQKNEFVKRTLVAIGDVPKIKVRENISEDEALKIEAALIKAIGRQPRGPLFNRTDNRNGPTSDTITNWHASRSIEERQASAKKGIATRLKNYTPEQRSATARANALAQGREILALRMSKLRMNQSENERKKIARNAGLASAAVRTEDQNAAAIAALQRYRESSTSEERQENFKKSGIFKATKAQLSEWGRKGAVNGNANRSPEERSANSRKGIIAARAARTPEENLAIARKGGFAGAAAMRKKTSEERQIIAFKTATTRRQNGTNASKEKGGKWINDGRIRKRLKKNEVIPQGWIIGYLKKSD